MRAHAHAAAGPVGVVRRAAAFLVVEISLRDELGWVLKVALVVVGRPRVHVEDTTRGDHSVVVLDVLDAGSWEADGDDGEEPEDLLGQRRDVRHFFLHQAFLPGFAVLGVHLHDFLVCLQLDVLALGRRQVSQTHDHVAGDGVDARGNHGQADGFELGVVQGLLGVLDDVARDAWSVGPLGDAIFEHVQESRQIFVTS